MQDLLVHNPVGLLEVDSQLIIKQANLEAERIFGYEAGEMIGLTVQDLIPHAKRAQHAQNVTQFSDIGVSRMMGNATGKQIFKGLRKDGDFAFIQIGINLIKRGEETVYLIAACDCKELHAITESLKASNMALQHKVDELEELKRRKNHFMSVISHELKTPLQSTLGLIELLHEKPEQQSIANLLDELENCAFDIQRHVRTLTDFANSQQGALTTHEESCNLSNLLNCEMVHASKRFKFHKTKHKLEINLPEHARHVVDASRLKTVIYGLLCNAYLHADAHEIVLKASIVIEDDRCYLSVDIQDDGVGMTGSIKEHIDQPLSNIEQRRRRGNGGLGLGLYLYNKYIQSMNGTFKLESYPGKGTVAQIRIPVYPEVESLPSESLTKLQARTDDSNKNLAKDSTKGSISHIQTLKDSKVLLVEDDKLVAKVTKALLQKVGAHVSLAHHGAEALEVVEANSDSPYDIVLMDLDMPVMNGYEATKQLRLKPEYAQTPILAITAGMESEAFPKALASGIDHCFSKPFLPAQLLAWLSR